MRLPGSQRQRKGPLVAPGAQRSAQHEGDPTTLLARLERTLAWQRARSILAVRLDNLGDVLLTTPALTALADGGARKVTLLASGAGAVVAAHVPAIADVVAFDAPWVAGRVGDPADERRLVAQLARRRFDAAVVFTVCTQSALPAALLCRLAGIPLRAAYSRENPYALLTDWVPDTDVCGPGMRHEVSRRLDLVQRGRHSCPR